MVVSANNSHATLLDFTHFTGQINKLDKICKHQIFKIFLLAFVNLHHEPYEASRHQFSYCRCQHHGYHPQKRSSTDKMKLSDKHHLALDCMAVILTDTGHQAIQFHCCLHHSSHIVQLNIHAPSLPHITVVPPFCTHSRPQFEEKII